MCLEPQPPSKVTSNSSDDPARVARATVASPSSVFPGALTSAPHPGERFPFPEPGRPIDPNEDVISGRDAARFARAGEVDGAEQALRKSAERGTFGIYSALVLYGLYVLTDREGDAAHVLKFLQLRKVTGTLHRHIELLRERETSSADAWLTAVETVFPRGFTLPLLDLWCAKLYERARRYESAVKVWTALVAQNGDNREYATCYAQALSLAWDARCAGLKCGTPVHIEGASCARDLLIQAKVAYCHRAPRWADELTLVLSDARRRLDSSPYDAFLLLDQLEGRAKRFAEFRTDRDTALQKMSEEDRARVLKSEEKTKAPRVTASRSREVEPTASYLFGIMKNLEESVARRVLEMFAKRFPRSDAVAWGLARIAMREGKLAHAEAVLANLVRADPRNQGILADSARVALMLGNSEISRNRIRELSALNPQKPELLALSTAIAATGSPEVLDAHALDAVYQVLKSSMEPYGASAAITMWRMLGGWRVTDRAVARLMEHFLAGVNDYSAACECAVIGRHLDHFRQLKVASQLFEDQGGLVPLTTSQFGEEVTRLVERRYDGTLALNYALALLSRGITSRDLHRSITRLERTARLDGS